jgi:hypothetical protein
MISKANGSIDSLVGIVHDTFLGFCIYINLDAPSIAPSHGWEVARGAALMLVVHFCKQPQIAVPNLAAASVDVLV